MKAPAAAFAALALLLAGVPVQGAVYLYGDAPAGNATSTTAAHYSYAFMGRDWPDEFSTCGGQQQSPINVPLASSLAPVAKAERSTFDYGSVTSTGNNLVLINNGHTVVMALPADLRPANVTIAVRGDRFTASVNSKFVDPKGNLSRVSAKPLQLHFHAPSEHLLGGKSYPLELHIVHSVSNATLPGCGSSGCLTVLGILFEVGGAPNPFIEALFDGMPTVEKTNSTVPLERMLDFNALLPADASYITYPGSLTTPPCTEGVLWHLMTTPQTISAAQAAAIRVALGDTSCDAAPASLRRRSRRLLASRAGVASTEGSWEMPPVGKDGCRKLGNGQNNRDVQALGNTRGVWFYAANTTLAQCALSAGSGYTKNLSVATYQSTRQLAQDATGLLACSQMSSMHRSAGATPAASAGALLVGLLLAALL